MQNRKTSSYLSVLRQSNSRRRLPDENGRDIRQAIAVLLMAGAIVLGGGGTSNPLSEVVLQAMTALLMLAWAFAPGNAPRRVSVLVPLICLLVIALPLIQLIPLPPSIWQALPGRGTEIASLALIGRDHAWMPWSMAPPQTLAVGLAMIPPLAMMWFVASLDDDSREVVIHTIVVLAVVSVLLGALQIAAPPGKAPTLYEYYHQGYVIGFQANRNAEVDVLLIGLLATATLYASRSSRHQTATAAIIYAAASLMLLVGAVLSGSRGGILLIPATLFISMMMLHHGGHLPRRTMLASAITAAALLFAAWMLRDNGALSKVFGRFATDRDFRSELWTDTIFAIHQYWPVGGGLGTFVTLMTPVERLEVLDETLPSRAHNDYLELLLESGVVGPIILAIAAICILVMVVKMLRSGQANRPHIHFAFAALFVVAAHSLVDYPMRSMSLAMLVGAAAGLLAAPGSARRQSNEK